MKEDNGVSEAESVFIRQMMRAEKTLPDDFFAAGIVQEIATLIADVAEHLTDEQISLLVGIGAYVHRTAKSEMMAAIQTKMAFARAAQDIKES